MASPPTRRRYLTKSRFKVGYECPTKLHYLDRPEYGSTLKDDAFLEALAEGGFQVGELAKYLLPGGHEITTLDPTAAAEETDELLKQANVILYEPAIRFGDCLVRVDLLKKTGESFELYEVKAKGFDPSNPDAFCNQAALKRGELEIAREWEPYLIDVAFQAWVLKQSRPGCQVQSFLTLVDKSASATVDGLNQRFLIERDAQTGRPRITVADQTDATTLGEPVLVSVPVDDAVSHFWNRRYVGDRSFEQHVHHLEGLVTRGERETPVIGGICGGCEFRIGDDAVTAGARSGFQQCFTEARGLTPDDFKRPLTFDVWNFRKSAKLLTDGVLFMDELAEADVNPRDDGKPGLSQSERQWLQVEKTQAADRTPFVDVDELLPIMRRWTYPLHFIDFETTTMALPFHRGRRPYEVVAFQFSHHLIHGDGRVEHRDEFLHAARGEFPNYDFVRALRRSLTGDSGTIFRYAAHENTVLCQIADQLARDDDATVPDRAELVAWIRTVTKSRADSTVAWEGARNMVDLCQLVKRFFFHPATGGSNSIKDILPAILGESSDLQRKYAEPIYGAAPAADTVSSLNYRDWAWIRRDERGQVRDPYSLLPPMFDDLDLTGASLLISDPELADGAAAMAAYARMQFSQMPDAERARVRQALLRYCELDTLAMVMIVEYWESVVKSRKSP